MISRIKKLSSSLKKENAFYVSGASDVFYLSGFSGTFGRIIAAPKKNYFLTDPRYRGEVVKSGIEKNFEIVITKNFALDLKKILSKTKTLFISRDIELPVYLSLKKFTRPEISRVLADLRMLKDDNEIMLIRKAISINESALRHIESVLKPGLTEKDLSLEFEYFARKNGADGLSFDPIIAFNAGSAVPHHKTSGTRLKKNTFILADTGVKYRGYCSDLTRCMCFGIIQTRLKGIQKHYNIVKSAKETGSGAYKNGSLISLADAKARIFLKKQGDFDKLFTHSLGHGLGIDVHEAPAVNAKEKTRFKPGMVVTCEPGIYMEGQYGIRLEDDYLVTEKGPEKLGKLSDGLIITG
jgi:Xaa-Pro aminopeptidase